MLFEVSYFLIGIFQEQFVFVSREPRNPLYAVSGGPPTKHLVIRAERQLGRLRAELEYAEIDEILELWFA